MIRKNSIRTRIAAILAIIFISTFLVKPVHVFFPHHGTTCLAAESGQGTSDSQSHKDCGICHYSFSAYTPQQFAGLQTPFDQLIVEISQPVKDLFIRQVAIHTSLRAPPVL